MHDRNPPPKASRLHTASGRWKLGLVLSLLTVLVWSTLPIALRVVLDSMDAMTVAWYRLFAASAIMTAFLLWRRSIPAVARFRRSTILLVLVAAAGMTGNYIFFLLGLRYTSPAAAQVLIQLAPLFLLTGAILFFRESFHVRQWMGAGLLAAGLVLFFHQRLDSLWRWDGDYGFGVMCIIVAAVLWAVYALGQKQLLRSYSSPAVMWMLYVLGAIGLASAASFGQLWQLDQVRVWLLIYCSLNTVVGYGCFAEALQHWEATKVGAVIATTPLGTLALQRLLAHWWPAIFPLESVDALSVLGAGLVVAGSILAALRPGAAKPVADRASPQLAR